MKECCKNCKYLTSRDILMFCTLNGKYIRFPRVMGGTKYCECYERNKLLKKNIIPYPKKED